MNLRAIKELYSDSKAKIDDQIISNKQIMFDLFYFGENFKHFSLSENEKINFAGNEYKVAGQTLLVNDSEQLPEDFLALAHNQLRIYMTTVPSNNIVIAKQAADIVLDTPALIKISPAESDFKIELFANGERVYFNGRKVTELKDRFLVGDKLVIGNLYLQRRPQQWKMALLAGDAQINVDKLLPQKLLPEYPLDFPNFRKSPRIYLREPEEEVTIAKMPDKKENSGSAIWGMLIPPIGMVLASILMAVMTNGNPALMIGMGSMSVLTAGYSVTSYFTNKKKIKKENAAAEKQYKKYILKMTNRLDKLNTLQKHVLNYNFPDMETLTRMVSQYNSRLYEKLPTNDDFLSVSIGRGDLKASYQIRYDNDESKKKREFEKFVYQKVVVPFRQVKDVPVAINLKKSTLGLVGNPQARSEALKTLLFQIASFQSYRDTQFILISSDEDYQNLWKEWRWLPHFQIQSLNLRGMVHNAQTRDMVLNSFYQLLVKRRQQAKEKKQQDLHFLPHFVLVITDESLLNGSNLNEFLAEDMSAYGVTVIWSKDTQSMLPETVNTLISYNSRQAANLINNENVYVNLPFVPNHLPQEIKIEDAIKRLANLHLVEAEKNSIPDSISFLGMYGVKNTADLHILERWQKADTSKTLAVPLGLRGKNDVVRLNLHERAHGPHGLIAGTTGSGKSEVLQSYILSLAVNFSPEDVGFLPIDYKGGGMANLFKGMPHMLGEITNLDGAATQRALKSIHAELLKRQRLFSQYQVNNINSYTKLYKLGKKDKENDKYPHKPLPHLFLISDEFAELKANEPDFMDELISTARIGRSLGVHLILATQKPSGVVNDQIWSNSKFKIALKVSDPADSKEVLHTPDAASITQPGRAYLQVGNNEIYELFQTAWSGATYKPNAEEDSNKIDTRIWLINHLGQAQLLTGDLSEEEQSNDDLEETELDAVVEEIAKENQKAKVTLPDKPWLPELAEQIEMKAVDWQKEWKKPRSLSVPFGMLDIPSQQKQEVLNFDLEKFNPAVIISSAGYGKSTALQTLVLNLARYNSPEQVQFNLLDFGANGLLVLQKLPHVADIASPDENEKFEKLLFKIVNQLDKRKAMFQSQGVANYQQYESATGKTLPAIVNVVDSYDSITESPNREVIDSVLDRLVREGQSLGIFLVMSSNRGDSFRLAMRSNINKKLALYLVDEDEIRDIFGRDRLIASPIPGRGQMEYDDEVNAFQIYKPAKGENSLRVIENIGIIVEEMDEKWQGARPKPIPMLPLEFEFSYFEKERKKDTEDWWNNNSLPLAFDIESTNVLGFVPDKHHFFTLGYFSASQASMLEYNLIKSMQHLKVKKYIVDFNDDYNIEGFTEIGKNDISAFKNKLAEYATAGFNKEKKQEIYVYVPSLEEFLKQTKIEDEAFKLTLQYAWRAGLYLVFRDTQQFLEKQFNPEMNTYRSLMTAGLITTKIINTNLIQAVGKSSEPELKDNEAYLFDDKGLSYFKTRLAKD